MASSIGTLLLAVAISTTGGARHKEKPWKFVLPPGPGAGWGFPNGNPDGYGYYDPGYDLPLGDDRGPMYHFPRYYAVPTEQLVMPTYLNVYTTRGQKFLPFVGDGGCHSLGRPYDNPTTPISPYNDTVSDVPKRPVPNFDGRVEAKPVNTGGTGLRP